MKLDWWPSRDFFAQWPAIALAALVGATGGAATALMGLPLGWLLGAMTAALIADRLGVPMHIPRPIHRAGFLVIGVATGANFVPATVAQVADWWEPLCFVLVLVGVSALAGWLLFRRGAGFDHNTAVLCIAPAGLNIMLSYSDAYRADARVVALVHAMRQLTIVIVVPVILSLAGLATSTAASKAFALGGMPAPSILLAIVGCAVGGHYLSRVLCIGQGTVLGPLIISAALHLTGMAEFIVPRGLLIVVQILIGTSVGLRFRGIAMAEIRLVLRWGIAWGVILLGLALGIAALAYELTPFTFTSLMLALTPGGLPEMSLFALALGLEIPMIVVCNLTRFFMTILGIPLLMRRVPPGAAVTD